MKVRDIPPRPLDNLPGICGTWLRERASYGRTVLALDNRIRYRYLGDLMTFAQLQQSMLQNTSVLISKQRARQLDHGVPCAARAWLNRRRWSVELISPSQLITLDEYEHRRSLHSEKLRAAAERERVRDERVQRAYGRYAEMLPEAERESLRVSYDRDELRVSMSVGAFDLLLRLLVEDER